MKISRLGMLALAGAWFGVSSPATAWAQGGGGKWVGGYFITVLCVALGLVVVCRSSGRADEPKSDLDLIMKDES